ncbi:GldG family protein [Candidatus Pacearchaeota archaeon]|nr:GldG family protein [Candidatus Pacearchaeota archaeon]
MANFIAARHFFRVDLTLNQLYAVSDASKTIMKDLDDIVTVKVFFSEKLPPNLFSIRQYIGDVLDELSSYSKGNLVVQFLNPELPEVRDEALSLGIPQVQMNIVEKDKLEVKNGFLGASVVYGDRAEILPVVQSMLNVEYDLVAAIKKVTSEEVRVVGFLTGHGEPPLKELVEVVGQHGESYSLLKQALERNYEVRAIDLTSKKALAGVHTLMIAGPKTPFSDDEKYVIDQFLMEGGHIAAFLDSTQVKESLETEILDLNLDDLLEHYGVLIGKEFVLDHSNENASFNQGFMNFVVPYPYWVKAVRPYFEPTNPIVSKLEAIVLPWISPLYIIEKEGVDALELIYTTKSAWLSKEPFNLDPSLTQNLSEKSQYPLSVLLKGRFASFFSDDRAIQEDGYLSESKTPGYIFVIGNSRFVMDRFTKYSQNLSFAMNAIDFLTLDESLISIRSKTAYNLSLKELSINGRQLVKFIGVLLMPILVVVFGMTRLLIDRKKKTLL